MLDNLRKQEACLKLLLTSINRSRSLYASVRIVFCSCGLACGENHWLCQIFIWTVLLLKSVLKTCLGSLNSCLGGSRQDWNFGRVRQLFYFLYKFLHIISGSVFFSRFLVLYQKCVRILLHGPRSSKDRFVTLVHGQTVLWGKELLLEGHMLPEVSDSAISAWGAIVVSRVPVLTWKQQN